MISDIGFRGGTFASAEGDIAAPSTTLTGSIRTSKITGCLRLQPTGFNTMNHAAKVLQRRKPLSVSVTYCHFPSRFGVICHFLSLIVTFRYFLLLFFGRLLIINFSLMLLMLEIFHNFADEIIKSLWLMKRIFLLFVICLVGICNVSAQHSGGKNVPLRIMQSPAEGDDPNHDDTLFPMLSGLCRTMAERMEMHIDGRDSTDYENRLYLVTAQQDTVINGQHYLQYGEDLFLREQDNKVLLYSGDCSKSDLVLYDFNLQVGDSLAHIFRVGDNACGAVVFSNTDEENRSYYAHVTKIETIVLQDGKERKKWVFGNGMEYVEGIGTWGNDVFAGDFFQLIMEDIPLCLRERSLVCVCKNGKMLYEMPYSEQVKRGATCLCEQEVEAPQWCDQWNVFEFRGTTDGETEQRTWLYTLSEDTVIGAMKYRQILCQPSWKSGDIQYIGAMRTTADDKVYFHYEDSEYLLYDFGAETGDTLTVFAGLNYVAYAKTQRVVVDYIGGAPGERTFASIRILPDEYRPEGDSTNWVWGVGTQQGLLQTGGYGLPGGYSYALLCAYHNGECVYTATGGYHHFYVRYNCMHNSSDETSVATIPAGRCFTLQGHTLTLAAGAEARLYDLSGRCLLHTCGHTTALDVWQQGVYVLQVSAGGTVSTYRIAL